MKKISVGTQSITNKDSDSLDKYFKEINKIDLISSEEEVELSKQIKNGDEKAKERLISANLRFVITVAKQYQNQGLSFSDLISEGNVGLVKASERFDETRGYKFITYAVWWIRQAIIKSLSENGRVVRLPMNKIDVKSKIAKASKKLRNELGREPNVEEIAFEMDEEIHFIQKAMCSNNNQSYLDDPLKDGENGSLVDVIKDDNAKDTDVNLIQESLSLDLSEAFDCIHPMEADILKKVFGIGYEFPLSCKDIGKEYKLGSERIRQMKDIAMRRLKFIATNKKMRNYIK
jgi:RNA polymerase primary sigma factor